MPPPNPTFPKLIIAATHSLSAHFLELQRNVAVTGLPAFLSLLTRRISGHDPRGLLTVSNHKSVLDDPLMWGVLPRSFTRDATHVRHALGSADICFTGAIRSAVFRAGQVHPTYRLHKSSHGGLHQPVMTELVQLLEAGGWVHVFPEGRVHQQREHQMRYFKWGTSRFILEPRVAPRVVPMFVTGFEEIMHEARRFPRFIPRVGKDVGIVFGEEVLGGRWEDLRERWRVIRERYGEGSEEMKTSKEATELRIETTMRVREEVNAVRWGCGFPEESEDAGKPGTYKEPGMRENEGKLKDGTYVKDT